MDNQIISVVDEYFKPMDISVTTLPITVEFENSSYINIEIIREKLLIVFSTNIDVEDLQKTAKQLLSICYFRKQKNYIIKLGMLSTNKLCFVTSLSVDEITLPAIDEIISQLIVIKDSLL